MRRVGLVLLVSCASAGPASQTVSSGPWRASYRDWSGVDVCETEPTWLREELDEANEVLTRFTAHGGSWRDDELPVLEAAARALPPLVEAHGKNLEALRRCPGSPHGVAVETGLKLVEASRAELTGAAKLLQFSRHRHELEEWRKVLEAERETARERCVADAGYEPVIYFAWGDELAGTTWLFCDGATVNAPLTGSLELTQVPEGWPAARAKDLRTKCFELARLYPPGQIKQPPR